MPVFGNSASGMLLYVGLTTVLPITRMVLLFLMPEALLPAVIWVSLVAGIRLGFSAISRQTLFLNFVWWVDPIIQ
jgi:hypothetical protein